MKPAYFMIIIALVVTVTGVFLENAILNISAVIALVILVVLLLRISRKIKTAATSEKSTKQIEQEQEKDKSAQELLSIRNSLSRLQSDNENSEGQIFNLYKLLTELDLTVPIVEKLSVVISQKSEESTLSATEKIFTITGESQQVSKDIQTLLQNMSTGDNSLERGMDKLLAQVEDFRVVVDKVDQLKKSYVSDMQHIEKTVSSIKELSDSISDIADQTSILAINASIEAARAGKAGVGFAVIAGETQKLARDSKQITERITLGIKEIGSTIGSSFQRQSETLSSTVIHLQDAKESFHQMTFDLAPQIRNIGSSVQRSKDLSETITSKLNDITMSLQYQDATRQILEHIIQLVTSIQDKFIVLNQEVKLEKKPDRESINNKLLSAASDLFTVREEWLALDLKLDESHLEETENKESLGGDITLF